MRRYPRPLWVFAIVLALAVSTPYIVGAMRAPSGWEYSGALASPGGFQVDYNSHLAKMWQGRRGEWDYHLLFTHEPHTGILGLQAFYVSLGALSAVVPVELTAMYHIVRVLLTLIMVLGLWEFAGLFFDRAHERWLTVLFGTLATGFGWLLYLVAPQMTRQVAPIEFWLQDAYNILGALFMPHFVASIILQIIAVLAFDRWLRGGRRRQILVLTLALAAESIIQPYVILLTVPLFALLTGYHLLGTRRLTLHRAAWLLIPFMVHTGLVLYQYLAIHSETVWTAFSERNLTSSPNVLYYLLGYLPFILPIALGGRALLRRARDADRWEIPLLWVALVALLVYSPVPTQRRYLLGVQTPLAALAAYGWSRAVLPRFRGGYRTIVTGVYITLAAIAPLLLIVSNSVALSQPESSLSVFYRPGEARAFSWLRKHSDPGDLVLTTFDLNGGGSGGRVVGATGRRVFMGHWIETVFLDHKLEQLHAFYDKASGEAWRRQFLRDIGASFIWYDRYSLEIGSWDPAGAAYLDEVFAAADVVIYAVVLDASSNLPRPCGAYRYASHTAGRWPAGARAQFHAAVDLSETCSIQTLDRQVMHA